MGFTPPKARLSDVTLLLKSSRAALPDRSRTATHVSSQEVSIASVRTDCLLGGDVDNRADDAAAVDRDGDGV